MMSENRGLMTVENFIIDASTNLRTTANEVVAVAHRSSSYQYMEHLSDAALEPI